MARLVRFGPFELNIDTGELRKYGRRVRLQEQPFRVLRALVERPGDLISRTELQELLWPNGTVVETDYGINAAVKRLRDVLSDTSQSPRYIETLPRKGYRWIAPVETSTSAPAAVVHPSERNDAAPPESAPSRETVGQRYEILDRLGSGGMGVVYKARDIRLGRIVALKFLAPDALEPSAAVERMKREARAASALSHPNICTIFEIDDSAEKPYIAMEYVEGSTLAQLIDGRQLSIDFILDTALAIADALDAAHAAEILHRDIKPANIIITTRGQVKVLDFGLAKFISSPADALLTHPGAPVGTFAYMSPEQARGEPLDCRSDLFSFGCVLFEMVTGRSAFTRDTPATVYDRIRQGALPSPAALNPDCPARLEAIIAKALEKDRNLRYQTAADLRTDLRRAKRDRESAGSLVPPQPSTRQRTPAVLAVSVLLTAAVLFGSYALRPTRLPHVDNYVQITHDERRKAVVLNDEHVPLVAAGNRLYFLIPASGGRFEIGEAPLTGGDTAVVSTSLPSPVPLESLTPRSALVVGSPAPLVDAPIWIQPLPTGSPQRMGDVAARAVTRSPDGSRFAATYRNTLFVVNADGSGRRELVTQPPGHLLYWPRWSPDGLRIRFSVLDAAAGTFSIWETSSSGANPHPILISAEGRANPCCGVWTADGRYFVFVSEQQGRRDIWALSENVGVLTRTPHHPLRLTAGPLSYYAPLPSSDGRKLFVIGDSPRGEMVRFDLRSRQFVPYLSGPSAWGAETSRDGQWVAAVALPEGTLWRSRIDGSDHLQLTFPPLQVFLPRWSPDGKQIAFYAQTAGHRHGIFVVPSAGGAAVDVLPPNESGIDPSWSPDGSSLVYESAPWVERGSTRKPSLRVLDLRTRTSTLVPGSEGACSPRWSPDGNFIAAMNADSNVLLLYSVSNRQWSRLMAVHIGYPNWSHDSKYVYFDRFADPPGIGRVRVSDAKVEQVVNVAGDDRLWTLHSWTGLSADDSPLLVRDISMQQIYALDMTWP